MVKGTQSSCIACIRKISLQTWYTHLEHVSICATADSLDELEVVLGVSAQNVTAGPRV